MGMRCKAQLHDWRLLSVIGFILGMASFGVNASAAGVRIADITDVEGVRTNTLTGIGLVTGLAGTGGDTPLTREVAANLVRRFGMRMDPALRELIRDDTKQSTDNMSVVVLTAELPAFARPSNRIDVTVSTYDNAESLLGGVLVMSPLFGVDGQVYATAAGSISIGGFSFSGDAGGGQKNHPTTGRIANGAIVEKTVEHCLENKETVNFLLRTANFQTASRITEAINRFAPMSAQSLNAGIVSVKFPPLEDPVEFVSEIQQLKVIPDLEARVVINERTGTVVIGENVRISKVAITHANLTVVTSETPQVSQPEPFSDGQTVVVPRTDVQVTEGDRAIQVLESTTTVGDLAAALNLLEVTPRDLSSIFQQLKTIGALHAKLEFQ